MTPKFVLDVLRDVQCGTLTPDQASTRLANLPYESLGSEDSGTPEARIDHHRELRTGLPEVIYAAGKTPTQTAEIFAHMAAAGSPDSRAKVLATRATADHFAAVQALTPAATWHEQARCITFDPTPETTTRGHVAILCAGTSDLPVAEEAAITASLFGARVTRLYDVGVAGLHRLLSVRPQLLEANVVIVCAGMEGALPSVVGGLVAVPVIAVPTSVGYGASFGGLAALLGMLNSCSPNVSVVNIDNGFGAAYSATLIARAASR